MCSYMSNLQINLHGENSPSIPCVSCTIMFSVSSSKLPLFYAKIRMRTMGVCCVLINFEDACVL